MAKKSTPPSLSELLRGQPFCLLTTYRKDGTPVPTAMWFATDGEVVYMSTKGGTAKVKRLLRDPKVTLGPCDGNGRVKGPQSEGVGQVLEHDSSEGQRAEKLLAERYGLKRRILMWALSLGKDKSRAIIAVRPAAK